MVVNCVSARVRGRLGVEAWLWVFFRFDKSCVRGRMSLKYLKGKSKGLVSGFCRSLLDIERFHFKCN